MQSLVQLIPLKTPLMLPSQAGVQMSDQVQRLVSTMKQEDYTLGELMQLVGLTHRATF